MVSRSSKSPFLSVTPLGGVGEIGSNCTVFENDENLVIVDYGILFPYEDFFDINYLIASLESIKETTKKVSIFITHGHEDHIGAIAHINKVFPDAEVHAPKFAERLIRKKLHMAGQTAKVSIYNESTALDFGNFEIHPIAVTHSIPDTYGLIVKAKNGNFSILFISDFKFDLNPLYERPFNTEKIQDLFAQSRKNICMIDSTNILSEGKTLSERDLVEDLAELVRSPKRLFFTLFSSNIHRLRTLMTLAQDHGKRIVPIGRSVRHYLESANECGLFGEEFGVLRDEKEIQDPGSKKNIYILTGCQGDHFGALRRVACGEHKFLEPGAEDVFIFSSKPIPGNESKIYRIYNQLTEKGASIITYKDKRVHASGHPGQEDLKQLYDAIEPDVIIPIHGESYFLKKHLEFINRSTRAQGLWLQNFHRIALSSEGEISSQAFEPEQPTIIHGKSLVIEREAISKRRKMACNGICFISLDRKTRKLELTTSGLPQFLDKDIEKISNLIKGQLSKKLMERDVEAISEEVRIFARNLFNNFLGYKPVTLVHVL